MEPSLRQATRGRTRGFTLIELLMTVALIGVLTAIALPVYNGYQNRSSSSRAVNDITMISARISLYWEDARAYPATLADIGLDTLRDPWGNSCQYLNLQTLRGNGQARKNRSLVPLNTDYDLYSMGPDGRSVSPLTARASQDDIVRANDGRWIGIAADY